MQHQQQIRTDIERNLHSYIHFLPVTCSINFHCSCHFIHTILSYFLSFSSSNTVFYFFLLSKYKNVLCVWNISKEKKQIQLFTWFLGYTFADRMMIKTIRKQHKQFFRQITTKHTNKQKKNRIWCEAIRRVTITHRTQSIHTNKPKSKKRNYAQTVNGIMDALNKYPPSK